MSKLPGDQYTIVSAAGSVVVSNKGVTLKRILIPGTYIGSVEFYDSATVAGTAASNNVYNVVLPGLNLNKSIDVHARTRTGLVYAATGTPTLTFTWD